MPGYTGFKPTEEVYLSAAMKKEMQGPQNLATSSKIPGKLNNQVSYNLIGYSGYVSGVKSENVFGESFGKSSGQAGAGQIQRGFDQSSDERYKSMAKASYINQRELL